MSERFEGTGTFLARTGVQMRHAWLAAAVAAFAWTAVHGAAFQDGPAPQAGVAQQGRGTGPGPQGAPPGRQGGGGRGPNYPQQQRPAGDPDLIARGRALFGVHCTACHGADLRGGDQGGPNLLRSQLILTDQKGENILTAIRDGRQGAVGTMPAFHLPEHDILAIAEYIHSVMGRAGRQGRPPERETPIELNVLVGNRAAGEQYFAKVCSRCHSAVGDLRGIAARVDEARELQNLWVSGREGGRGRGDGARVTVTVTAPGGAPVTGRLVRIDDFVVTLLQEDGARRTFRREGVVPRVDIHDPLEPHRRIVLELGDADMHNVTAYLATLK